MKMGGRSLLSVLCKGTVVFLALISFAAAGEIELKQSTPVFERADVFSPVLHVLPPGKYETAAPGRREFSVRHPIAWYGDFVPLKKGGFASASVSVDKEGTPFFLQDSFQWQTPVCAVLIAGLAVLVFLFFRGKRSKQIEANSHWESLCFIMIAVLLRQILVLCETAFWGNALPCAADEPGYFKVAYDILHGSFDGPWHFTIGLGILYLPFIVLSGAERYYDIAVIFSYFDALIIAPGGLAVAFCVLKNFKIRSSCAFTAIMIWAVYPFFVYHVELWDLLVFKPLVALPTFADFTPDWWRFYSVCINAGFNAMSDTPGVLAVLCTMLLAQKLSLNSRNVYLIGTAFGFCCLIRINYIFFAPILGWICVEKLSSENKWDLFKLTGAAAGGFLTIFIWQFLVNIHQFGNPLTFGYSLHYLDFPAHKRPDTGFNWSTLWELRNIRFLIGANKFLMTGGIAGLLFIRCREIRIALTLTAVPLLLFFFGYTHTYCDARRFIMMVFPVFIAAFCCGVFNMFTPEGKGMKRFVPLLIIPFLVILWFLPAEIYAICLCLLLLRTFFDLQQKLKEDILRK